MPFIQATGFGAVGFGVRCDKENEQDKCGQHVVGVLQVCHARCLVTWFAGSRFGSSPGAGGVQGC